MTQPDPTALAAELAELALAADFGGNDIAGLRNGIIADASIQAFVDRVTALASPTFAAGVEAAPVAWQWQGRDRAGYWETKLTLYKPHGGENCREIIPLFASTPREDQP